MSKPVCDLKSCFMCKFCLHDWLPAIAANKKNIAIKKGQQLFKEGDPVTGIYFVYTGVIKVHKRWGTEKELILRFAGGGDVVGQLGLGNDTVYPVTATAIEAGIVCYVDMAFFESTLNVNNAFTRKMMTMLAQNLQESEKRMRNLAHMPVKGRVAQALINLQNQFGLTSAGFINIELSRQDLASFTGAAYESLFRTINDMIEDKLITTNGKAISIIDLQALLKLTDEAEV
jgi:CRP-like cAMP-binding protein